MYNFIEYSHESKFSIMENIILTFCSHQLPTCVNIIKKVYYV